MGPVEILKGQDMHRPRFLCLGLRERNPGGDLGLF
jgi:hypothetical protein